ncbi:hypothetical protein BJ166DRAFT_505343 [Pestalotiopsis sp. NC0098]|nr:hypothetical protein BJ166DRAFT_505343 [Pestalotiopsis sp. NC0098]
MFSVRRAALRAASSSSLAAATSRQQLGSSFALRFAAAARPAAIAMPSRFFTQTARVAQDENESEKNTVEEAIKSTETLGSTQPPSSEPVVVGENQGTGIYVSNMSFDVTEEHLKEAYAKYGEIVHVNIARDARGLSRGFGFVEFADKTAAEQALAETDQSYWHGRRVNVQVRKGKPNRGRGDNSVREKKEPTTSLYIGNIPYDASDADLNKLFRELENVTDVRVAVDRNTGWPRGFAHADFTDLESAQKAFNKIAETKLFGRTLIPDFATQKQSEPRSYRNHDRTDRSRNDRNRGNSRFSRNGSSGGRSNRESPEDVSF